jgi:hypothetical protein
MLISTRICKVSLIFDGEQMLSDVRGWLMLILSCVSLQILPLEGDFKNTYFVSNLALILMLNKVKNLHAMKNFLTFDIFVPKLPLKMP